MTLVAPSVILPSVAFGVARLIVDTPSIALGLLLVTCCPAGALSNYLTGGRAIGLAVVFFPALAGVAITSILWGVVHLTLGLPSRRCGCALRICRRRGAVVGARG